jgi:hypothetical protein
MPIIRINTILNRIPVMLAISFFHTRNIVFMVDLPWLPLNLTNFSCFYRKMRYFHCFSLIFTGFSVFTRIMAFLVFSFKTFLIKKFWLVLQISGLWGLDFRRFRRFEDWLTWFSDLSCNFELESRGFPRFSVLKFGFRRISKSNFGTLRIS